MKTMTKKDVDWNMFNARYSGHETAAFERLTYLLFLSKTGNRYGLFRYKNHPGIETSPVMYNNKLTGFQSKFFDSKVDKDQIIHSIETTATHYQNIQTYYVYINIEPGANYKNPDKKPSYMKDVERAAKKHGFDIEWQVPSHIEAQLVLPENDYIYDIFFGDDNSKSALVDELGYHSELRLRAIEDKITFNGEYTHFDRSAIKEKVETGFRPGQVVVVSGEGGSGKTALIKNLYQEYSREYPMYVFRASEMNVRNPNEVFRLDHDFTLQQFIDAHADESKKIFIIDSAERLAEIDDNDALQILVNRLLDANWCILFATRTVFLRDLSSILVDGLGLKLTFVDIPLLSEKELSGYAAKHRVELPDNERFRSRLCNLFYLGEFLKYYDQINIRGTYREFVDKLWKERIQGDSTKKELCSRRDTCLVELARMRSNSGAFFVSGAGFDPEALFALKQDEIIGFDEAKNQYFITHDIYEEWALQKLVERAWRGADSVTAFFNETGSAMPVRRAFRMWLLENIQDDKTCLPDAVVDVIDDASLPAQWSEEVLVAVLLSDNAHLFLSYYGEMIQDNDFCMLKRILFLLRIACVKSDGIAFEVPVGSGWSAVIDFLYRTRDTFFYNNMEHVLPVLKAWSTINHKGDASCKSGKMAISVIERALSSEYYLSGKTDEGFRDVMFNCAAEIRVELGDLLRRILDTPLPRQPHLMRSIAKEILQHPYFAANNVIREFPEEVISLCEKSWIETRDSEEYDAEYCRDGDGLPVFHSFREPNKYGLTASAEHDYFPPSANQTPIGPLLRVSPVETLNFIIRLVNHFAETYAGSGFDNSIVEVTITLGAKTVRQYHSDGLWQCYRGTGSPVLPNLLRSVHMALESWLFRVADNCGVDSLKGILLKILGESKSSSLTAVVTSLILRHSSELVEVALPIISQSRFIDSDMIRCAREWEATSLARIGRGLHKINDIMHGDERDKSNAMPHRSKTLQHVILEYQITPVKGLSAEECETLKSTIFNIIDGFKADSDVMDRMSHAVECMDARNLKMEVTGRRDNAQIVQLSPIHESEHSLRKARESQKQMEEATKYSSLRLWCSCDDYPHQPSDEEAGFTENPESVVVRIRELIADSDHVKSVMAEFDGTLPQIAASKLLREHSGQLSDGSIVYCCQLVTEGYCRIFNEGYCFQVGDGVKESAMALPYALLLSPDDANDIILAMALSMVRVNLGRGYRRMSEFIPTSLSRSAIWSTDPDVAESVLGLFIELQHVANEDKAQLLQKSAEFKGKTFTIDLDRIDYSDIFMLESLICSLPTETDNPRVLQIYTRLLAEMPVRMFRKLKRGVDSDEVWYAEEAVIKCSNNIFDHIAPFLLMRGTRDETDRYLGLFAPKMDSGRKTAHFLRAVILAADALNRPEHFYMIWESMFTVLDGVVSNSHSASKDEIILCYLFSEAYWREQQQWHSFTPQIAVLFSKAASKWAEHDVTLYAIGRAFSTIGSRYLNEGLKCLGIAVNNRRGLPLKDANALCCIENFMTRFCLRHNRTIRENPRLKTEVRTILTYMVDQGSARAYRQRDLL